ncbi:MAG TPA: efflux RND transporter permease subunit [Polyangia bacterium]|jgi:Cu(I)/Ag(I) efflux system membrane protein CusA/SilA|nr:efflux RND transporter permease subunit [Polyangia bacterium]
MVERIIEFCARHRVLVLVAVGVAVLGATVAMRRAKLDAIPDLSDPQVIVYSEWMGRSPTLVEDQVTYPIVSKLIGTPHVADVRGFSMFGMSFVYVVFEEGTDVYWARSRVLEYLNGLHGALPEGVSPNLGPDATGTGWVFQYSLVDKTGRHGLDDLRTFQDFTLRYALGSVAGVAEVASVGGYQKQYQVTVDPTRLRAQGVTLTEVIDAIRQSNDDVGGRILEMSGREYYVRGRGYITKLADLENVPVRGASDGAPPLLVKDVGTVRFGPDIRRGVLDWNGEGEAVGGIVVMRYGENALDVIERVKKKVAELRPSFPAGVELDIAYDRSSLIERSVATLRRALVEEGVTVGFVIILFLLHVRSSLLPILSLPISVMLAFIPMVLLDIPSTIMSLGGIAIAIGATVDAEIVMIEACHKKLESQATLPPGADRHKLLAEAAKEVTPAIFFSLLIIAVAFLPVFTLTGQAGRLFKPLAYTKTFVMLISAILSITFAPALRDLLIRGKITPEHRHPVSRFLVRLYEPFVWIALRRPKSTVAIGLFALASAVPLAGRLGHEFMPPLNEGDLLYMPITFPNISIEQAKEQLQRQDAILRTFPEVETVFGKVGRAESATDPAPITMVETTVRLRPQAEWRKVFHARWYSARAPGFVKAALRPFWPEEQPMTWDELTGEMNRKMQFPGWTNAWTMPIKTRIDMLATGVRTPVGVKIFGSNLDEIERMGAELERVLAPIAGTRSVLYERSLGGLYVDIVPRPEKLARYGLRVADVERLIESAIGGTPIGVTVEGRNRFSINVRYPRDARGDLEALRRMLVPVGAAGAMPGGTMGTQGALWPPRGSHGDVLADNMDMAGAASPAGGPAIGLPAGRASMSDAMPAMPPGATAGGATAPALAAPLGGGVPRGAPATAGPAFVPLGELADVRIVGGPPMVRDEAGLLVGYVYVDIDQAKRDLGGYVDEAKARVARALGGGALKLPPGSYLKWTGQYEQLEEMAARMKLVVPLTLLIIFALLYLQFRNVTEVLIVLLSIPFALVGSVWLLWLLDYRLSTAVWVGIIALVGLAAQTGIIMMVYVDNAYRKRKAEGRIHDLRDIIAAHMEGTVQRVRPKLMTVSTMLIGLVPLLWAKSSGADVMKRIAAPMVGGLVTSAFLTLEIIPVVVTYWRQEQLLWERLAELAPERLRALQTARGALTAGAATAAALAVLRLYVAISGHLFGAAEMAAATLFLAGLGLYLVRRSAARAIVWPAARDA